MRETCTSIREAIQYVEKGTALADSMKDFAPVGVYCAPNVFTQSNRSGEVFALCEQSTRRQ